MLGAGSLAFTDSGGPDSGKCYQTLTHASEIPPMKLLSLLVLGAPLILALSPGSSIAETGRPLDTRVLMNEIAKNPAKHELRVIAGFHFFDQGDFAAAETHFQKASQLSPDDPYDQAWLYMAQLRRNKNASQEAIRAFIAKNRSEEFVYTAIQVLLSDVTPEEAVKKAGLSREAGNVCEAHYYAAQRLLADGQVAKAKANLQEAIKTRMKDFWEYKSAVACLKSLEKN
jgi:tetratricopeptide (TPR) repeat protein